MIGPPTHLVPLGEPPVRRRIHVFAPFLLLILIRGAVASIHLRLAEAHTPPSVQTKNGTYHGLRLPTFNQDFFGGIPFAQPAQRLLPSISLNSSFHGVRTAEKYGVGCVGFSGDNIGLEMGEDCLTLNVVRQSGMNADARLPVLVWIYGGGFGAGTTNNPRYNGSFIVQRSVNMSKPIIFASFNYRVTAFGFPVGDDPTQEGILNLGLKDQRLALRYIQENIEAFGGDPTRVTIFGESAGGASVYQHLLAYGGRNDHLFRGAIAQSGYFVPSAAFNRSAIYERTWQKLLFESGCQDLACLRTIPLDQFTTALQRAGTMSFQPVIDGDFIQHHPAKQINEGRFVTMPLITGANSDEGTGFLTSGINTTDALAAAIIARNASDYMLLSLNAVDEILDLYPDDPTQGIPLNTGDGVLPTGLQDKRSAAFFGDAVIIASRRAVAKAFSIKSKLFSYRFNQPAYTVPITTGATHFAEVAYVFNNPVNGPATFSKTGLGPRPQDMSLGLLMSSMWISFTHDQTPNNPGITGAPEWPEYGASRSRQIVFQGFGSGSHVEVDDFRREGIALIVEQTTLGAQST